MMRLLDEVMAQNRAFIGNWSEKFLNSTTDKKPSRQLALFTCMDTRLVDFLEPAMGIARGEVKVIKNAGNSVTGPFESTIRSLVIGIFELGVKEVMVVGALSKIEIWDRAAYETYKDGSKNKAMELLQKHSISM